MKILHVIASMDPANGGVCQAVRNSIPPLLNRNCQCDVVSLDTPTADFGVADPFPLYKVGPGVGPWCYSKSFLPWALDHLPNYECTIVHGLWQYHSYAVAKAIRSLERQKGGRTPRVFAFSHGMLDPWFQRDPSRRLKAIRNYWYWKAIEHRTVNRAYGVLFTCQRELELAREPFRPYRPKQELNVGMGVESPPPFDSSMTEAFQAACPDLEERPYLLFLSRIHPKKGVDLLLHVYEAMSRETTCQLPALVIAGPIDGTYAKQMIEMAAKLRLRNVFFPGMLSGDAKWGAFYDCDAFILPSHQENFGIAVVEALACGKPVLISDQVNIYSEIVDANAGIVGEDSLEGTAATLKRWASLNPAEKQAMGTAAIKCFEQNFEIEAAARSFLDAISATPQSHS